MQKDVDASQDIAINNNLTIEQYRRDQESLVRVFDRIYKRFDKVDTKMDKLAENQIEIIEKLPKK